MKISRTKKVYEVKQKTLFLVLKVLFFPLKAGATELRYFARTKFSRSLV